MNCNVAFVTYGISQSYSSVKAYPVVISPYIFIAIVQIDTELVQSYRLTLHGLNWCRFLSTKPSNLHPRC